MKKYWSNIIAVFFIIGSYNFVLYPVRNEISPQNLLFARLMLIITIVLIEALLFDINNKRSK